MWLKNDTTTPQKLELARRNEAGLLRIGPALPRPSHFCAWLGSNRMLVVRAPRRDFRLISLLPSMRSLLAGVQLKWHKHLNNQTLLRCNVSLEA